MFDLTNFLHIDKQDIDNDNLAVFRDQGTLILRENQRIIKKNRANLALITQTSNPDLGYINTLDSASVANVANVENMDNIDSLNNSSMNLSMNSVTFANGQTNSKLALESNYLQYVIWLLLSFFLILLTFHTFNADDQSLFVQLVLGGIIIYVLYLLVLYIKTNYF